MTHSRDFTVILSYTQICFWKRRWLKIKVSVIIIIIKSGSSGEFHLGLGKLDCICPQAANNSFLVLGTYEVPGTVQSTLRNPYKTPVLQMKQVGPKRIKCLAWDHSVRMAELRFEFMTLNPYAFGFCGFPQRALSRMSRRQDFLDTWGISQGTSSLGLQSDLV